MPTRTITRPANSSPALVVSVTNSEKHGNEPLVECPFCKEDDFDLVGLKIHFTRGYCQAYNYCAAEDDYTEPERKPKTKGAE
jgi:hypothetical protein